MPGRLEFTDPRGYLVVEELEVDTLNAPGVDQPSLAEPPEVVLTLSIRGVPGQAVHRIRSWRGVTDLIEALKVARDDAFGPTPPR
jgi:hypothetical protein